MEIYVDSTEPHFDDERTLRSAQPVVPLEKINAKARHRKQWFLGGAFAIAMLLGAASALLASYFKLRHVPTATVEVSEEADVAPTTLPLAETAAAATPEPQDLGAIAQPAEEPSPAITPKKVRHRPVEAKPDSQPEEPRDTQLSEHEELNRIRQAVLVDEWQERRARRVERRERRRQERYNHRDLSNLDEIFEGRRRP